MEEINELEELIKKDRIEEFCERILQGLDKLGETEKDNELVGSIRRDVFVLSSNLHGLLNMNRKNVIDLEQYSIGKSRVITGLLDVLKEYKLIRGKRNSNIDTQIEGVLISNKISEPIGIIFGLSGAYHGNLILVSSQVRKLTFGRGNDYSNTPNDVFISIKDNILSRAHFKIRIKPMEWQSSSESKYQWRILDLASSNGTFVNGNQITQNEELLKDGDIIQVGDNHLQVRIL